MIEIKDNNRLTEVGYMIKRQYLIKFVLSIIIFVLAFLIWIEGDTSLASITGVLGFLFLVPVIFGCKNYKYEVVGLNFMMYGLGLILFLQIILSWNSNPVLSIICGVSGIIFFIASTYDKKTKNRDW